MKVEKTLTEVFLDSMYAGLAIGLGGMLYLACENKIVGSCLFSIGLISVLVFNFELYTGRVCYPEKRPYEWPAVWIGNFAGANCMCLAARICHFNADSIVSAKMNKSLTELFVSGILCGICIAIAVKGYRKTGNLLIPVFGVMAFILIGAEHCVADMFYAYIVDVRFPMYKLLIITLGNTLGGLLCSFRMNGEIQNG